MHAVSLGHFKGPIVLLAYRVKESERRQPKKFEEHEVFMMVYDSDSFFEWD